MNKLDLSIFDLDHTLLNVNISFEFGKFLYYKDFLSFFQMLKLVYYYQVHKSGFISIEKLHEKTFEIFFKGKLRSQIDSYVTVFLKQLPGFVSKSVFERVEPYSCILSSSPDFLVGPVAEKLGKQNWEATSYSVDKEGYMCEISLVMEGLNKAKACTRLAQEKGFKKESMIFYTDSILDAPVFDVVGTCVAVRPDNKLRKLAQNKGWEIIDDTETKRP